MPGIGIVDLIMLNHLTFKTDDLDAAFPLSELDDGALNKLDGHGFYLVLDPHRWIAKTGGWLPAMEAMAVP